MKVITESKNGTKVPVKTEYLIEGDSQQIKVTREFYFSQVSSTSSDWEPHVIRAYPRDKFTSYTYPSTSGKSITGSPEEYGTLHSDWDGTWAVVEALSTQLHILLEINKKSNLDLSGLWTDKDAWSSTSWIYPAISSPSGGSYTTDGSVSITYYFQVGSLVIPTPTLTPSPTPVSTTIVQTITAPSTTTVSRGKVLGPFSITESNNSSSYYNFNVQPYITKPDGTTVNFKQFSTSLNAGETRTHSHYLNIPTSSELGIFTFGIKLTDTKGNQIDNDSFAFTVTSGSSKTSKRSIRKLERIMRNPDAQVMEEDDWKMVIVPEEN